MPKMIPLDRKNQDRRVHLRVTTIHRESVRPVMRADMANAKGIAKAVNPR